MDVCLLTAMFDALPVIERGLALRPGEPRLLRQRWRALEATGDLAGAMVALGDIERWIDHGCQN